jgi:hypothetical protein
VVTPNHREALKVSVGPGRQVQLNDVTLPKSMLLVTMKGVVLDDQKRPAAGAEVHLLTDHGRIPLRPFQRTGADGAFAFAVVEGHAYKVLVNYDTRDARGWTLETFWGEVTFNGTSASPLVIQLRRSGR